MKKIFYTTVLFFIIKNVNSQELATTESGKKVQLYKDGTYKYIDANSNETTVLKIYDFKTENGKISCKNRIYVIDGDEKTTQIEFSFYCNENTFKQIEVDKITEMIRYANIKSMFLMKNRRTYIPKSIRVFFSEESKEWMVSVEYTAQNDYGAIKDGLTVSIFSENGSFKSINSI